jgi:hypothetical protein
MRSRCQPTAAGPLAGLAADDDSPGRDRRHHHYGDDRTCQVRTADGPAELDPPTGLVGDQHCYDYWKQDRAARGDNRRHETWTGHRPSELCTPAGLLGDSCRPGRDRRHDDCRGDRRREMWAGGGTASQHPLLRLTLQRDSRTERRSGQGRRSPMRTGRDTIQLGPPAGLIGNNDRRHRRRHEQNRAGDMSSRNGPADEHSTG